VNKFIICFAVFALSWTPDLFANEACLKRCDDLNTICYNVAKQMAKQARVRCLREGGTQNACEYVADFVKDELEEMCDNMYEICKAKCATI
jgi:hypothetical protein